MADAKLVPEVVVLGSKHGVILGEGALWHAPSEVLYWVDILKDTVYLYRPAKNELKWFTVPSHVGAVVPKQGGGLILALKDGFYSLDAKDMDKAASSSSRAGPKHLANPEANLPLNRFNDGKVAPNGWFYAGTTEDLTHTKDKSALYALDDKFQVHKVYSPVTISNGLAWTKDKKTLYYVDTPQLRLDAFDFNMKTGELTNHRVAIQFSDEYKWPDGITIDNEDNIWVAHWDGARVTRWNPRTGKLLQTIKLPTPRITSVAFGGPHLRDLYITSSSYQLDVAKDKYAGSLFVVRNTPFTGVVAPEFGAGLKRSSL